MANEHDGEGTTSSGLQGSQSGGHSGEFGGNQYQPQSGQPAGGGVGESDISQAGGSSGTGGYGDMQNQANHQGQGAAPSGQVDGDLPEGGGATTGQSRGERFDEEQGGGRGPGTMARWDEKGAGDAS